MANAQDTNSDVVIVGAGAAGLYAAYTLDNLGFDVLVLEARPRIGGRVHPIWQRQHDGHDDGHGEDDGDPGFWINSSDGEVITVELGAMEVMGTKNSFVHDDINAAFPGRLVPCFTYDKNQQAMFEATWDNNNATVRYPGSGPSEVYDYWDFYVHTGDNGGSHAAGISNLDDLAAGGSHSAGITPSSDSFHLYAAHPGSSFQVRLDDMDVLSQARQAAAWQYGDGTNCFVGNEGYLKTLNALYFDDIIHLVSLDTPVVEINTAGAQPFARAEAGRDSGVFNNHYAGSIIVAISVGRLLSTDLHQIDFVPDLPTIKTDAMATLNGKDVGGKIILKWDSIFWNPDVQYMITDGVGTQCWQEGAHKSIPASDSVVWACELSPDIFPIALASCSAVTDKQDFRQCVIDEVALDFLNQWSGSGATLANLEDSHWAD
jgi:hypothetical protein